MWTITMSYCALSHHILEIIYNEEALTFPSRSQFSEGTSSESGKAAEHGIIEGERHQSSVMEKLN